ncbi:hypothetical protein COU60_04060 [Candidatus Pacearchaeota archaeon CG10_big_fil_rev_8_21_14_0_10_34_76]|nr:MAG: hypothetical protein COU60_04060 [Candidatus Pacearchaeota archaeon CG10_big_fil_rev_8_21_14_0_10_34_76]
MRDGYEIIEQERKSNRRTYISTQAIVGGFLISVGGVFGSGTYVPTGEGYSPMQILAAQRLEDNIHLVADIADDLGLTLMGLGYSFGIGKPKRKKELEDF